jgi:endonuclease/exonuclease/phosphatase family metal-dependent hydrolase
MTARADVVLASLNVHGGRGAGGEPFDLAAACRRLAADVIAVQETWRPDGEPDPLTLIARGLGATAVRADLLAGTTLRALNIAAESGRGCWGLAVLTRLPVAACDVMTLGRAPGDLMARAAQLVTVTTAAGRRLLIVNTHLTHRFVSPVQLLSLRRRLAAGDVPAVIVGDLNMPGPVTGLAAGFRQAVKGATFPAHRPLVQLDHILTGRGVSASHGEVLPPAGSDHLPIRARLRLS